MSNKNLASNLTERSELTTNNNLRCDAFKKLKRHSVKLRCASILENTNISKWNCLFVYYVINMHTNIIKLKSMFG